LIDNSIDYLFLSCIISETLRDCGRKSQILPVPPVFCALVRSVPLEFN